ncbi:MAG: DNA starvation/stationary phase protection protein [Verrucomicrobiota bacterium]
MKKPTKASKADSTEKLLGRLLADTYALLGQTQFAHWNVQGPAFFSLHTFLEAQYEEIFQAADVIAERLRALDVISPGGLKTLAALSSITELPVKAHPAKDLVSHLLKCHEVVVKTAIQVRDHAGESGDAETEDLAIARLRVHEKTMWMFRAFLKNP